MSDGIRIYRIDVVIKRYQSSSYVGRIWDVDVNDKIEEEEEEGYIAKASFRDVVNTNINPVLFCCELTIKVNLDDVDVDEEEVKERVKNFVDEFVKKYMEYSLSIRDLYNDLLDLFTDLKIPYSTIGHEVHMYDSGGDYPEASLNLIYYG